MGGLRYSPPMGAAPLEARKAQARTWFERLRDDICSAFEAIEQALPAGAHASRNRYDRKLP